MGSDIVKADWKLAKEEAARAVPYSLEEARELLLADGYYKTLQGKAKNRTLLKKDPRLYKAVYEYTGELEKMMVQQGSWKWSYGFYKRVLFIAEHNCKLDGLKCKCGAKYIWSRYCRKCPDYKANQLGKPHSKEVKRRLRLAALEYIATTKGQPCPRYNKNSIPIIEDYGKKHGYNFLHAENGGEYCIKELGYYVDAYDPVANVVLEVDERHHFDHRGMLKERDQQREAEIKAHLGCEFIRIKYGNV